jgi:hypothetical protein
MNKTTKVGPQVFKNVIVNNMRDKNDGRLDGEICYGQSEIHLDDKLDDFGRKQVLWHEIFHGILTQAGMQIKRKEEESLVDALSYGIISVLEDNPWLVRELEQDASRPAPKKNQGGELPARIPYK